ncbi:MAG: dihydrofolate reductase [Acidimicrobiia bacterium]|nr:dihydrofolate reductase [Acidimicrobiia bacterium]
MVLVAAVARNGVIGTAGQLPWHIPADLAHFKSVTIGKPIVMGRATFDSIGRPLPGRSNIVLTRQEDWSFDGVLVARTPQAALDLAREDHPNTEVCVIGGGQVYELFMPVSTRLEITSVHAEPEGDAHFPVWDQREWRLVAEDSREGSPPFTFQTWIRASTEWDS